jgi:PAS domain S-box-containing protein
MTQTSVERQALMKAIKQELRQRLWEDLGDNPAYRRYRSLFVMNPVPMWVYATQTLGILDVNAAAVERYGYTREEFLRLNIKDLRPDEDVPKFLELTQKLPSSDRTGPWRHRLKSGDVIQVLITSRAVTYAGRRARIVMAEQLTGESEVDVG